MIYDNLKNLKTYIGLSDDIRAGLLFLQQVSPDIELGEYELTPNVKAIVSQYLSMKENPNEFEAHQKFIDIQYTIIGSEIVRYLPLSQLTEKIPYSEERDITFYKSNGYNASHKTDLVTGSAFFAILFPQDGHMPQLAIGGPQKIKKIVIKVKIN